MPVYLPEERPLLPLGSTVAPSKKRRIEEERVSLLAEEHFETSTEGDSSSQDPLFDATSPSSPGEARALRALKRQGVDIDSMSPAQRKTAYRVFLRHFHAKKPPLPPMSPPPSPSKAEGSSTPSEANMFWRFWRSTTETVGKYTQAYLKPECDRKGMEDFIRGKVPSLLEVLRLTSNWACDYVNRDLAPQYYAGSIAPSVTQWADLHGYIYDSLLLTSRNLLELLDEKGEESPIVTDLAIRLAYPTNDYVGAYTHARETVERASHCTTEEEKTRLLFAAFGEQAHIAFRNPDHLDKEQLAHLQSVSRALLQRLIPSQDELPVPLGIRGVVYNMLWKNILPGVFSSLLASLQDKDVINRMILNGIAALQGEADLPSEEGTQRPAVPLPVMGKLAVNLGRMLFPTLTSAATATTSVVGLDLERAIAKAAGNVAVNKLDSMSLDALLETSVAAARENIWDHKGRFREEPRSQRDKEETERELVSHIADFLESSMYSPLLSWSRKIDSIYRRSKGITRLLIGSVKVIKDIVVGFFKMIRELISRTPGLHFLSREAARGRMEERARTLLRQLHAPTREMLFWGLFDTVAKWLAPHLDLEETIPTRKKREDS